MSREAWVRVSRLPSKVSHGVRQAEHAGADHRGDVAERHIPPFGAARGGLTGRVIDDLEHKKTAPAGE